ncbi:MAG: hypothetical protein LBV69_06305 [Bacteroidales bacterium]|nr:hypothetical protein [Bacteroidales bacterium]
MVTITASGVGIGLWLIATSISIEKYVFSIMTTIYTFHRTIISNTADTLCFLHYMILP